MGTLGRMVGGAVLTGGLGLSVAACGGGGHPAAAPTTTAPTSTTTTVPASSTSTSTTTAPPTTGPATPAATSVVGLVVDGSGATLTKPASPTVKPYSSDCHSLIDAGYYGECLVVSAPSGTLAAIVERQLPSADEASPVASQERDLVYERSGSDWYLALRRVRTADNETQLFEDDLGRDGHPEAVFVVPSANSDYADEIDVVEGNGAVSLYRQLHGGFATVPAGGGLTTYTPAASGGYQRATIERAAGVWRITGVAHVSQSQAQADQDGPFSDSEATEAT